MSLQKLFASLEDDTAEIDKAIEVMEAKDSSDPEDIEKVEDYKEELEKLKQQEQQEEGTTEESSDTESTGEGEATDEGTGEESPETTEGSEEPTEESSEEPKESEGEQNGEVQENQEGSEEGNGEEEVTSTESLKLSKEEIMSEETKEPLQEDAIQEPVVTEPVIEPVVEETPEATIIEAEKEIEVDYEVMIKEGEENLEPIDGLKEKLEEAKECGSMESITAFDFRKARKAIEKLGFSIEGLNMVALSTESENHAENLDTAITNLKEISTKVQRGIKMAKDKLADSETK